MDKKSSKDYKKEYKTACDRVIKLENSINDRLFFLANKYPDVPIIYKTPTVVLYKAKSLADKFYISTLHINHRLEYIMLIENYLGDLSGKQIEINFNENE